MSHQSPPLGRRIGAALVGVLLAASLGAPAASAAPKAPDLGASTYVFDPSMPVATIQATVNKIHTEMVDNEMGTQRYALLFKPGTYGTAETPLDIQVGYYTEVAGLGALPTDVVINGKVEVHNRCLTADNCIALNNFWRGASNLTINVTGAVGCYSSANFWAASQAAPLRRVKVVGKNLSLMDYCTAGPQYASGGYLADSDVSSTINGSQQQYYVRDSVVAGWSNGVWNQVFSGVKGAPATNFAEPQSDGTLGTYTNLATTPVKQEKPFLFLDGGAWKVFLPETQTDASGTSWGGGQTPGSAVSLNKFFVAHPGDTASTINKALATGKDVLFTPGIYNLDAAVKITRPNTVVLGIGLATLNATAGNTLIDVASVSGVTIAGLTLQPGATNTETLMRIGAKGVHKGDAGNPVVLNDVYVRVGGPQVGKATTSIEVNSDNTILDHLWVWRADHGDGVGWNVNTADQGVIVNGNHVTALGLFVEHFQKYNVIWNGEAGRTIFFQNELPYDPPTQEAYSHDGVLGWAAYKVADNVKTNELWGGGSYIYTNVNPSIHVTSAFEVPVTPGVVLHDVLTVNLNHVGTIDHIVNLTGSAATPELSGRPQMLVRFPVA